MGLAHGALRANRTPGIDLFRILADIMCVVHAIFFQNFGFPALERLIKGGIASSQNSIEIL